MKKSIRRVFPLFTALFFILNACSTSAAPQIEASPPVSEACSSPAAADIEADYAVIKQTYTISGVVDAVTPRTVTLACDDGVHRCFDCGLELIESKKDTLVPGSRVTIEYSGLLDDGESFQSADVVGVTVDASPYELLMMRANAFLETLTLPEKVGQMFLVHYPAADAPQYTLELQPGGYILFGSDFRDKTPEDITAAIQSCQQNAVLPMLIGVDEEGGTVNRVSRYPQYRAQPFSSPQRLYEEDGWYAVINDTLDKAALLKALGINLNLAPVCDVSTDPSNFIYKRAFGADAGLTAQFVRIVVETMVREQLGCVLKHFPGYGNNADTHTGSAYDARPYETFLGSDFIPFEAGIGAGAGAVMVSHNIVACMEETAPASLSAEVHRILREELGFDGVVITDDVNMRAVWDYSGGDDPAVLAVLAGNDMICTPYPQEQIPAVLDAVENGLVTEERIDASVLRILIWKLRLGIIEDGD